MKRLVTMNNKIPILCNLVGQFNEICSNLTLLKYQRVCAQKIQSYHIYIENFGLCKVKYSLFMEYSSSYKSWLFFWNIWNIKYNLILLILILINSINFYN